jgi:hypothetical protein
MVPDKLNQAIQLIKAGNKQAALPLLKQIVQSEPDNEMAWLWLYSCVENLSQKKYCLQKALEINPNNINAHNAKEKLSSESISTPQIKGEPARQNHTNQPSNIIKKTTTFSSKQETKPNRVLFLISGIITLVLCTGGLILGGVWAYKNSLIGDEQSFTFLLTPILPTDNINSDNNQNLNNNTDTNTPAFISTQVLITPTTGSSVVNISPTETLAPPNFTIYPIKMRRIDGEFGDADIISDVLTPRFEVDTTTGYDTLVFDLIGENKSDDYLELFLGSSKISTAEGYEYDCRDRFDTTFRYGLIEYLLFLPETRWRFWVVCRIPELTTRHALSFDYAIVSNSDFQNENISDNYSKNTWQLEQPSIVFTPLDDNANISIPLLETVQNNYAPKDVITHTSGEQIEYGDVTLSFELIDGRGLVNIRNNNVGENTKVEMRGLMFLPGENHLYDCSTGAAKCGAFSINVNPAQSTSVDWMHTDKTIISGTCILLDIIKVSNSANTFVNTKPEMICFR